MSVAVLGGQCRPSKNVSGRGMGVFSRSWRHALWTRRAEGRLSIIWLTASCVCLFYFFIPAAPEEVGRFFFMNPGVFSLLFSCASLSAGRLFFLLKSRTTSGQWHSFSEALAEEWAVWGDTRKHGIWVEVVRCVPLSSLFPCARSCDDGGCAAEA